MASVKFSRKEFEKHIKLNKEIEEKISMMGTHMESLNEEEIELEIMPNRPDLLSLQGFVRAFSAFIGKKTGLRKYAAKKYEKNFEVTIDKSVKDVRPYTACAIVKNLKFDDEKIKDIMNIQEKIHATIGRNRKKIAIGIYPLEHIRLPIRFEARVPENIRFVPLEMSEEMNGLQILQRHPKGRDYSYHLEGKERFPVFVDANNEIMSMPPIINSSKTGKISDETRDVFIECSGFDLNSQMKVLNILVTMFADMGGQVYQMKLKYDKEIVTPDLKPEKMKLSIENVNNLLGTNLKEAEIKNCLEKMGYEYSRGNVFVPCYRTDIIHEVDLIEDIAIAYGYDKFVPEIPPISSIGEENREEKFRRKVAEILTGLEMLETSSLHFVTKDELKNQNLKLNANLLEVEDSKTDYRILRHDLLICSLRNLSNNSDSEYPQKIFEIGSSFEKDSDSETGIKETCKLAVSLAPGNFTDMKQILEYLGRMIGKEFKLEEVSDLRFIDGRAGKITLDGEKIGMLGEISPQLLKNWHIKMPVVSLELDLDSIMN